MNPDPDDAPSRAELLEEQLAPLAWWVTTPASPLRVRDRGGHSGIALFCVEHPEFHTTGNARWVERYAIQHALEHGVTLPPSDSTPFSL